jgi:hypothetical protein
VPARVSAVRIGVADQGKKILDTRSASSRHTYKDNAGNIRVTLHSFSINMVGGNPDNEGIDARPRV